MKLRLFRRSLWVCCWCWCAALAGDAAEKLKPSQPRLNALYPMAAQPGTVLRVQISGDNLDGADRVEFEESDLSGRVVSSSFTRAEVELRVDSSARPGARYLRLLSPRGPSNLSLFRVTRWTASEEQEPNDRPAGLSPLSLPILMSARLSSVEDVDFFRFHLEDGQRVQFNLLGARNWTGADLSLAILDSDLNLVAADEGSFVWDPYIDHVFERGGEYLAAVTITRMPAGGQSRTDLNYQLAVGQAPFLWSLFPTGNGPGQELQAEVRGHFLAGSELQCAAPHLRCRWQETPGSEGGRVVVQSDPELEPGAYDLVPAEASGTANRLRLLVDDQPGAVELEPNPGPQEAQSLKAPALLSGRIHPPGDEDWFRLWISPREALTIRVDAEKYGSLLDAQLTLFDARGEVFLENDDASFPGRPLNRDPQISRLFDDSEEGQYFLRVRSLFNEGGPDHVYRLSIQRHRPDFALSVASERVFLPAGEKAELRVTLARLDGFGGQVRVRAENLPPGVSAETLLIPGDKNEGSLTFQAREQADLQSVPIRISAEALLGDRWVRREAVMPPPRFLGTGPAFTDFRPENPLLAVVQPPLFNLESLATTVYLVRGGRAEFGVAIRRRAGFEGVLDFKLENLPPGVTLEKVDLVDAGRVARLTLAAAQETRPVRVPDLTVIGTTTFGSSFRSEAAPRLSLQVD